MVPKGFLIFIFIFLAGVTPVVVAAPKMMRDLKSLDASSPAFARKDTGVQREGSKRISVKRVQTKIADSNARRSEHFLKLLERLTTILDKIASRSEKAKAEGKDVTSIETAIASARTAVTSAESAVNTQKGKTYQITVTDDTTARNDVGAAVKQLQDDLRAVQGTVKAARDAVQKVFGDIKTIVSTNRGTTPSATDSSVVY